MRRFVVPNAATGPRGPVEGRGRPAKPFFKCLGGKRRLLPELVERVAASGWASGQYFEPFVGGGALFWELANRGLVKQAHLNDANPAVADAYWAVQNEVEDLARRLRLGKNTPEFYGWVRSIDPGTLGCRVKRAAWFLYLNKTAFNGVFRVNKGGWFNVPFGGYRNPDLCNGENLGTCSAILLEEVRAVISCMDFESAVADVGFGPDGTDLVYFDPPYPSVSKTASFNGYTPEGFSWEDHERLALCAARLKARGAAVVLSNADLPKVRRLYKGLGFKVERVKARRNVNSDGAKRGPVGELLIS